MIVAKSSDRLKISTLFLKSCKNILLDDAITVKNKNTGAKSNDATQRLDAFVL